MNIEILQKIRKLPPLPESVIQIEKLWKNPDSTLIDLSNVIEKDALLTVDILKSANSPLYGFSRKITSIKQATSLFGMATIRGFALSHLIKNTFLIDMSPYLISLDNFKELISKQNKLATLWCKGKDRSIIDLIITSSFLVEVGRVVIACHLKNERLVDEFQRKLKYKESDVAEKEVTGMNTIEVTAEIFKKWRLDIDLIDVILHSDKPNGSIKNSIPAAYLKAIRVAIPITGVITDESKKEARDIIRHYKLDLEGFERTISTLCD
jgi:HD-like signal output (HDOD) protein